MAEQSMTGMAAPEEPMAPQATATSDPMPSANAPTDVKYDMETMMGNFLDMPQERRQLATRLLASPAVELFDEIIGEPAISALREQLGNTIEVGGDEETAPADQGMMSPASEPMADMPMEDEDSTPPV